MTQNRRPEPLADVRHRAACALALYLTHPDPSSATPREQEALSRGMTLLRRLATASGLSPRMVVGRAELIRQTRGPVALALALNAVEETGDPSELLAPTSKHLSRWRGVWGSGAE